MGRKSRAKCSAARRALLHMPASSETSEQVAYCPACGGITMGMQAGGLYEGLIFDLPRPCLHAGLEDNFTANFRGPHRSASP
jgi:hypothetical protein